MPRRFPRRRYAKKRKGGKAKMYRKMPNVATAGSGQMARIVETCEFADLTVKDSYSNIFSLAQFPRASTVAASFQFYKAAKVVWSYEPCYNTFQSGNTTVSKPYLYIVMNRTQNQNNAQTLTQLQACGARPQALIGTKKVSYRPNWCSPGLTAINPGPTPGDRNYLSQGLQAQYGWLASAGRTTSLQNGNPAGSGGLYNPPTLNPIPMQPINQSIDVTNTNTAIEANSTIYNGHTSFVDQEYVGQSGQVIARLTCTVTWLFKGAVFNNPIGAQQTSDTTA